MKRLVGCLMKSMLSASLGFCMLGAALAQEAVERRTLEPLQSPAQSAPLQQPAASEDNAATAQPMPKSAEEAEHGEPSGLAEAADDGDSANVIDLSEPRKPLRIGLVAERGTIYLQARIEPFRSYLQETLSRPVEVIAFNTMRSLMAAHIGHQIDYSVYPAGVFAMAYASCGCLTPIVAPVSKEAPDGTYMLLVVRGESGIKSLSDMAGRTMALSSKNGAVPYFMALNELKKAGLNPDRDLSSLVARSDPAEALTLLRDGVVDAALVWSSTRYNQFLFSRRGAVASFVEQDGKGASDGARLDFVSIWHSPAIPAGPHAIHNDLPKQEKADLVTALKEMNKRDPEAYDAIERYHSGGFRSVDLSDYAPLIEIATTK
ncbi:PhnD/SsuA/transferrin family substrate-binding protein [uncultured Cohaesibacter sp.]|uniref:phosphate/phosphite/phosphonate ABC transporter substrate-binding protein n=1 Tax=uncultured Cohaesibacter sp. TaxID=1002546 RepID=UPI00292DF577|nr:PhnD/SsuA/transferrin family substrate-binding protein [uncultured Cohaesibacter sp.]